MKELVAFADLQVIEYGQAWEFQENLLREKVRQKTAAAVPEGLPENNDEHSSPQHHLLFCEHPPVYTLGKSGKAEHILISEQEREEKGISFYHTNRGGDITFHGPGQIVGYPILDLERFYTDIGRYLRALEEVIIRTIGEYGLAGERSSGETGVWLDPDSESSARKICAMGVRCSRWVTMHGFALNVNTNLDYFNHIIPCGIVGKKVTSLQHELGYRLPIGEVQEKIRKHFEAVFDCEVRQ